MYVSARERQILQLLLDREEEMTVKEIAAEVQVSERTVHRDLKNVADILETFGLSLDKRTGIGIKIKGPTEKKKELELSLYNASHPEFTPEERQTIILCSLLASEKPVKLVALANELNVTVATVSHDLTKVNDWLASFHLSLIRKRGYGVQVSGSEMAKRRAISSLIMENMTEVDVLAYLRNQIQRKSAQQVKTVSERLLGFVEKEKLMIAEKAVEEIRGELPYALSDSAYIGLVVHLALALERLRKNEKIDMDSHSLEALKKTGEYQIASAIIDKLRKALDLEIPEAEVGYIAMHLKGAKLRNALDLDLDDVNFLLALQARDLIDYVSKRTNVDLQADPSLFQGLLTHLQPAIYRVKKKLGIYNPLLEEIKRDYGELFSIVSAGVEEVFPALSIPEAEIGYLVLHFASSLERMNELKEIHALILCSSGIGSSKMLATRIKKELPEIKRLHYASVFDLTSINLDDYDVIISTIPLAGFAKEYILVNPMLTENDVKNIRAWIESRRSVRRSNSINRTSVSEEKASNRVSGEGNRKYHIPFQDIHEYSGIISIVLEGFRLTICEDPHHIGDVLRITCCELQRQGVIEDPEAVAEVLLERQRMRGLGIPGSSLALFHARSPYVRKPSFTIWGWKNPLPIRAMDDTQTRTRTLLLMLSPEKTSKKALEVLSHISALIIESEESMALFESQDQEAIASYLSERFHQFLRDQFELRGEEGCFLGGNKR
ncbi:BglG family transcription antiterminator [Polycladomyces subterraneus]|uniref:BglG family transcription antiterminator n=1 Tax=Polycladomyces subterraneus TaxID=1016997 RepID=A0ABT8ILS5_9BACL|nr:BglG family transcription antiterminator [Polycladomyces subterraneus]MDN4593144.1 BglG family transcription antiterminator [Polycladomyces subterraneus]